MDRDYEIHHIVSLFPEMSSEERAELYADIEQHGLRNEILLYQGKILDGRHRYEACLKKGIAPRFREITAQSDLEAWLVSKSANLVRRHLAAEQRYAVLLKAAELFPELKAHMAGIKKEATAAQKAGGRGHVSPRGRSAKRIAKLAGVSEATVKRVNRVKKKAPEEFEKIAQGKTTTTKAFKNIEASSSKKAKSEVVTVKPQSHVEVSESTTKSHQEETVSTSYLPNFTAKVTGQRSFYIHPDQDRDMDSVIKLLKSGEARAQGDHVYLADQKIAWLEVKEENLEYIDLQFA